MATFILKSPNLRLTQLTSDGISSPTEFLGTGHYRRHSRNIIVLPRPQLVAIPSINDNGTCFMLLITTKIITPQLFFALMESYTRCRIAFRLFTLLASHQMGTAIMILL
jgi:hypothetical protein